MRSRVASVALAFSFIAAPAYAQNVFSYVSGSTTAFGYYVGNLNGTLKQGSAATQNVVIDCVDFFHSVTSNQTFNVNLSNLGTGVGIGTNTRSSNITLYKEAAFLSTLYTQSGLNSKDIGNIQATVWNLFGNTGLSLYSQGGTCGTCGATVAPTYWLSLAQNAAANNYYGMNFSNYYVVTDVNFASGGHQEFLMYNTSVTGSSNATPEPASFVLFGTGLAGLGIARRIRRRKTA